MDEREREIERQQEEQRMKLAHGGYNDMIDFEAAMKAGINPHGSGHPGASAGGADAHADQGAKKEEDPIRRILKHQEEEAKKEQERPKMAQTGEGAQVVFDPAETGHPKTPIAGESSTPSDAAADSPSSSTVADEAPTETATLATLAEKVASETSTTTAAEETRGHVTDEL